MEQEQRASAALSDASELVSAEHRAVYDAVRPMLISVALGFEPDPSELMRVAPDAHRRNTLLHELTLPQPAGRVGHEAYEGQESKGNSGRVLVLEDVHMCMESCEQFESDLRAVDRLKDVEETDEAGFAIDCEEESTRKEQPQAGPRNTKQAKQWSRKLFGKLACAKREAALHGMQLVKIPCALVRCQRCHKLRVVDVRASSDLTENFACGDVIQVHQEVECNQGDETLASDTSSATSLCHNGDSESSTRDSSSSSGSGSFEWVWVKPIKFVRD